MYGEKDSMAFAGKSASRRVLLANDLDGILPPQIGGEVPGGSTGCARG